MYLKYTSILDVSLHRYEETLLVLTSLFLSNLTVLFYSRFHVIDDRIVNKCLPTFETNET